MRKTIFVLLSLFVCAFAAAIIFAEDLLEWKELFIQNKSIRDDFNITAETESPWVRNFNKFFEENSNDYILYGATVFSPKVEEELTETEMFVYVFSFLNNNGYIFTLNENGIICNSYNIVYNLEHLSNPYYQPDDVYFSLGGVHGGIWSIARAASIKNNMVNIQFKIIKGIELKKEIGIE
ncbi:MAG: hypothetical protein LBJ31_05240 [Treponema sp.]|jgi:hypothetical protein|nr:hypothetical protein [Treponema sp.]